MILVYCPVCHWVWGQKGWLKEWGILDFAGGLVVHTTAGFGALASVFVVGPRKPSPDEDDLDTPHNVAYVALGTALLWFGWPVDSKIGAPPALAKILGALLTSSAVQCASQVGSVSTRARRSARTSTPPSPL